MARSRGILTGLLVVVALAAAACGGADAVETAAPDTPGAVEGTASDGSTSTTNGRDPGTVARPGPVFPLRGTPAENEAQTDEPAVVVKIDNDPHARPQAGLNQADLVYEIEVEGVTRFAAVFQSEDANPVGPIRSARSSDIDLVSNLNNPLFAWSGANPTVSGEVNAAQGRGALVNVGQDVAYAEYWRDNSRYAPHNLFSDTAALREMAPEGAAGPEVGFYYRDEDDRMPRETIPVAGVAVDYEGDGRITNVEFVWDPEAKGWARFQTDQLHGDGALAHLDAVGEQIAPENVVILNTTYGTSAAGGGSPQAWSVGTDRVTVLTGDGQAIEGTWLRAEAVGSFNLHRDNGAVIKLTPGRTWVLLPRPGHVAYLTPDRAQHLLSAE